MMSDILNMTWIFRSRLVLVFPDAEVILIAGVPITGLGFAAS
jgi:hypothetical protein